MNTEVSPPSPSPSDREQALIEAARRQAEARGEPFQEEWAGHVPEAPPGYTLVQEIRRGGMGVVYEARREVNGQRLALKFMQEWGGRSEAARRRFEREVELVSRLQHPHIVSIVDAGVHQGRYYYAMEYVDGQPLDEALPPGECEVREALRLIREICNAVDYAHQHGVLHRDLKPSNVLIDREGEPRLLDFGLAKALDPAIPSEQEQTLSQPGQLLGTLGYMSPEQSRGQFERMSVRSDVYSIGAIAYELLTGSLPCPIEGALGEVLERIASRDPPRPSSVRRGLGPDVDAILLKALDKSPHERYPTAASFAEDLRRFLANEAIAARRAGAGTRVVRWVRRNRALAGVAGAAVLVLAVLTGVYLVSLARQRDAARTEARKAQQTLAYIENMLAAFDPDVANGVDIPALRLRLYDWTAGLEQLEDQPEIAAAVRHRMGVVCLTLGLYDEAEQLLRTALAARQAVLGPEHPDTAQSMYDWARVRHKKADYAGAEELHREALRIRTQVYGPEHPAVAESLSDLAWVLKDRGDLSAAEPLYRQGLALRRKLLGNEHRDVADSLNKLAQFLMESGNEAEAEAYFREALAMRRRLHGERHTEVATSMANLGSLLRSQGEFQEAEPLLRGALEIRRELLGEHATTVVSQNLLGLLLRDMGRYEEAEALLREALKLRVKLLGPDHEFVAVSRHNLATILHAEGKFDEAEPFYRAALELLTRQLPEDHYKIASGLDSLADLLRETGGCAEAEPLARRAGRIREKHYAQRADHPALASSRLTLGWILLDCGDPLGAEPLLREAYEVLQVRHVQPLGCTGRAAGALGACLVAQGRYAEAEPLLVDSFNTLDAALGRTNRHTTEALDRVIELYSAWNRPDQAAAYRALLPAPGNGTP